MTTGRHSKNLSDVMSRRFLMEDMNGSVSLCHSEALAEESQDPSPPSGGSG